MNVCLYIQMSGCDIPTGNVAENAETVPKLCTMNRSNSSYMNEKSYSSESTLRREQFENSTMG